LAAHALLVIISILIIVPVAWVVMAAFKTKPEFFGRPWPLPDGLHWQNFVDAFVTAKMGIYFTDSLFVTVLGLVFSLSVAIPAA
ncbi:carbohydrate ABC transporter permease, partial [Klebsiella pneumoniae]|nr:carbohydrate ABC transporter permease [Klebsiella pneumoniae]